MVCACMCVSAWSETSDDEDEDNAPQEISQPENSKDLASDPATHSALTGELLFEILLGELNLSQGDSRAGFSLLIDAARKAKDESLFLRCVEVALRARAGDAALQAAQDWKYAFPESKNANQKLLQIQVAINKIAESQTSLADEIRLTPEDARYQLIASIPRFYQRASDPALVLQVVSNALQPWLNEGRYAALSQTVIGQLQIAAKQPNQALESAKKGHQINPSEPAPLWLGLELARLQTEGAEDWLEPILTEAGNSALQLGWAQVLVETQRSSKAIQVLRSLLEKNPDSDQAWLALGGVLFDSQQFAEAEKALLKYIALTDASDTAKAHTAERDQAFLALAQISIKNKNDQAASAWLEKITNQNTQLRANAQKAGILARKGEIDQALGLIAQFPARNEQEKRARLFAMVELMREAKQWDRAYALLMEASKQQPKDNDISYELAMAAEKIGKIDEMESILEEIIAQQPEYYQAYNALGYSWADRNKHLEKARQYILKALEATPEDAYIIDSLGWVEYRLGHFEAALSSLRKAFKSKPEAEIAAHLGEVLWAMGQKNEAVRIWREGRQIDHLNETLIETLKRHGFDQ